MVITKSNPLPRNDELGTNTESLTCFPPLCHGKFPTILSSSII